MSGEVDYYDELGVARTATADEIRKAYRRLARKYHPDVSKEPDAEARFNRISEAYEVLNDPEKRKTYDQFGRAGVGAGPDGFGRAGWSTARPAGGGFDPADFSSIFDEMFGRGQSPFGGGGGGGGGAGPFTAGRQRATAPVRGRDIERGLQVSFLTAARGGEERLRLAKAGGGAPTTIDVKVPAGTETGDRLRVRGKGEPGPSGGRPGDLILKLDVGAHPLFRREGLDLLVDVPVTLTEGALGVSLEVPLLSGTASLKVPPGTSSGRKLRIRGQGIADAKGRTGDFYAVVQIVAPEHVSERARQLLLDLADELQNPRESGPWRAGGSR